MKVAISSKATRVRIVALDDELVITQTAGSPATSIRFESFVEAEDFFSLLTRSSEKEEGWQIGLHPEITLEELNLAVVTAQNEFDQGRIQTGPEAPAVAAMIGGIYDARWDGRPVRAAKPRLVKIIIEKTSRALRNMIPA